MGKLLFFDIDGTILTEGKNRYVPESTKKAIKLLQANGHLCFINTGRAWSEIHDNITSLGFDGFVCGCGTYIRCHDKVLYSRAIPTELADSILDALEECRLEWVLEGTDKIYYSNIPYTTRIGEFRKDYFGAFADKCEDISPSTRGLSFDKFCVCTKADSDLSAFRDRYQEPLSFIDRGEGFFEIVPSDHSKASGIQFLMDYFHIPLEDTIAIGDSTNDLPMLQFAGTSIAMGKSDDIVLQITDYVTDTVEQDGIWKALEHYGLIEKN